MKVLLVTLCMMFVACAFAAEPTESAGLAAARLMKARADTGDAEAMYILGYLAISFGPRPFAKENAETPAWKSLLGGTTGMDWMEKSAEAGYPRAIAGICSVGEDKLAPAALREAKAAQCAELRAKYPAHYD
jgi:hypothetical protein